MNFLLLIIFFPARFIYRINFRNIFLINKKMFIVFIFLIFICICYLISNPDAIFTFLRINDGSPLFMSDALTIKRAEIGRLEALKMGLDSILSLNIFQFLFGVGTGGPRLKTLNAFIHITYYYGFVFTILSSILFYSVFRKTNNFVDKFILFSLFSINMFLPVFFDDKFNYSTPIFIYYLTNAIFKRKFYLR